MGVPAGEAAAAEVCVVGVLHEPGVVDDVPLGAAWKPLDSLDWHVAAVNRRDVFKAVKREEEYPVDDGGVSKCAGGTKRIRSQGAPPLQRACEIRVGRRILFCQPLVVDSLKNVLDVCAGQLSHFVNVVDAKEQRGFFQLFCQRGGR